MQSHGGYGVTFPRLADKVMSDMPIFGSETMLYERRRNAVCWNYASSEFVAVVMRMLAHPCVHMVRTTAQRYYDYGAPVEIFHSIDDDEDCVLMQPVEGDVAGGYTTPHWIPVMFVWRKDSGQRNRHDL